MNNQDMARRVIKATDNAIQIAVSGAMKIPAEEGVNYLTTDPLEIQKFQAHAWVKNAVMLAYARGLHDGAIDSDMAPDTENLFSLGFLVIQGGNMYKAMSEIAQ